MPQSVSASQKITNFILAGFLVIGVFFVLLGSVLPWTGISGLSTVNLWDLGSVIAGLLISGVVVTLLTAGLAMSGQLNGTLSIAILSTAVTMFGTAVGTLVISGAALVHVGRDALAGIGYLAPTYGAGLFVTMLGAVILIGAACILSYSNKKGSSSDCCAS